MRNSSVSTGFTCWPLTWTTSIGSPGIRTSKKVTAEALMKRSRTRSPGSKRPVQFESGERPFVR